MLVRPDSFLLLVCLPCRDESCSVVQGNVSYYCVNRQAVSGGQTPDDCPEVTASDIQALTSAMTSCFQAAVSKGMDIAITPHLDDGLGLGISHVHPSCRLVRPQLLLLTSVTYMGY